MGEVIQIDAPYRGVVNALRTAFKMEAKDVCAKNHYADSLGGDPIYDRIAQGIMTISIAKRNVGLIERYFMMGVYTEPHPFLIGRKELDLKMLSWYLYEESRNMDRWFVYDACRKYANLDPLKTDARWADELGKTERTLRHWKYGNRSRREKGIFNNLDDIHERMRQQLESVFYESGLTRHAY